MHIWLIEICRKCFWNCMQFCCIYLQSHCEANDKWLWRQLNFFFTKTSLTYTMHFAPCNAPTIDRNLEKMLPELLGSILLRKIIIKPMRNSCNVALEFLHEVFIIGCIRHHAPCIMHHAPSTMHFAAMHNAPHNKHHAPRTLHHASCIMHHAPCRMHHAPSPCTLHHHHGRCTMHQLLLEIYEKCSWIYLGQFLVICL